jgi:hypothetical protein
VLLSDTGDTLVKVYANGTSGSGSGSGSGGAGERLVATVQFAPGSILYPDGKTARTVVIVHVPDASGEGARSDVISITLPELPASKGVLFSTQYRAPRICLVPQAGATGKNGVASLCLASRADAGSSWSCDDRLLQAGNDGTETVLCGYVRHFTQFSLFPRAIADVDAISDPDSGVTDRVLGTVPLWVLIFVPVCLCCCILIVCVVCLARRRSRDKKTKAAKEEEWQEMKELAAKQEPVAVPKSFVAERKKLAADHDDVYVVAPDDEDVVLSRSRGSDVRRTSIIDRAIYENLRSGGLNDSALLQHRAAMSPRAASVSPTGRRRSSDERAGAGQRRTSVLDESIYAAIADARRGSTERRGSTDRRTSMLDDDMYQMLRAQQAGTAGARKESLIDAEVYNAVQRRRRKSRGVDGDM